MPQKSKRAKKRDVGKRKQNYEAEKNKTPGKALNPKGGDSLSAHFNKEELQELKNVIQSKDLSNVPLIIAGAILNKLDLIKDFVKPGCDVNETGPSHFTALMWAVKCKNIEMTEYLLTHGADPTTKNANGDSVLILALENKIWDEQSYLSLWKQVQNASFVDVNLVGKNGRTMVHAAVRREWTNFLKILISEKANINAVNLNGMTPLMLASYFNNFDIISVLLEAKAEVLREDANGCTALCHAISHVINKNLQPPHVVIDNLLAALRKKQITFEDFFKLRIPTILNHAVKQNKSGHPMLDTKSFIITYILRFTEWGPGALAEMDIFWKITQAARKHINQPCHIKKLLMIVNEILEHYENVAEPSIIADELFGMFVTSGMADLCLSILKMYGCDDSHGCDFISLAFAPLLTATTSNAYGKQWLFNHFSVVLPFYKKFLSRNSQNDANDDWKNQNLNSEKLFKFNELTICIEKENCQNVSEGDRKPQLVSVPQTPSESHEFQNSIHSMQDARCEAKSNSKKTKRRAKALKATIAKIKSADLTERLNQHGKMVLEQKCLSDTTLVPNFEAENNARFKLWANHTPWEQVWFLDNEDTPSMQEFSNTLAKLENELLTNVKDDFFNTNFETKAICRNELDIGNPTKETPENYEIVSLYPDWKNKSLDAGAGTSTSKSVDKAEENKLSKSLEEDEIDLAIKPSQEEIKDLMSYTLNYLSGLLKKIIQTYQKHWEQDKENKATLTNNPGDVTAQYEHLSNIHLIEKLAAEHIQHVQNEFDKLIIYIKNNADKHFVLCSKLIDKMEAILLNHKVRGKSIMQDTAMQVINVTEELDKGWTTFCETDQNAFFQKYMEKLLKGTSSETNIDEVFNIQYPTEKCESKLQVHPDILYLQEILALPPKRPSDVEKATRDKIKTMGNAYYLIPSLLTLCDESDEAEEIEQEEVSNLNLKYRKRQTLQETLSAMPKLDNSDKLLEVLQNFQSNSLPQPLVENTTSRWCTIIQSLQMMKNHQVLLKGDIRISCDNKDDCHVISTGGNFSQVILGLDGNDRPLAVKRIQKDNSVCKTMKTLLNPLLGLRNTNLLHYFSCHYEKNELILATPLCEYNMGEYIMIIKQSPNMYVKSIDIVKQFLAGLRFLHDRPHPVIHGNLKPSNIFIDLNGSVRIAEFGMHQALYTLTEASSSSIIWFSRETFATFKQTSTIMCTCASDIQVAGMLIHFILTAGKHPYGELTPEILKNLERAIPQLVTTNVDLHDLISWMLLYDSSERPTINQVLSHVFFWSVDRKWRFILTCAGIGPHGTPLHISLNELHLYINIVAARENIKGRWINTTKRKFPNLTYSKEDQDSIIGFLRFIRNCVQNQVALQLNTDFEFRNFILSSFPALPLSLYRILECSQWLNHRVLQPFTTVDSLSA